MKQSQTLTANQIKLILKKEGLKVDDGRILQIKKGNVNKIFIIKKGVILRFSDDSTSVERLAKEAEIIKSLKDKIPVPKIYSYGSTDGLGYQLLSHVPGERLSNVWPTLSNLEKEKLTNHFSQILKTLHSSNSDTYGTICIPTSKHKTWLKYCDEEFDKVVKYINDNLPYEDIKVSQNFYLANRKVLLDTSIATFVHGDLLFDNILVNHKRISAILDFEFASYASVEYELYKLEEFTRDPAHYGYTRNKTSYHDFTKYLKKGYPAIFNKRNLAKKLNLYDFIYTWKAFKYNDEFNLIERKKNLRMTQTKLNKILNDKISRII